MGANPIFYRDLAYVFVAAVLGGLAAKKLRQPLILGYVVAGMLIGPFTPGPTISELHGLELFAEVGVILLMYSIGLEFSFRDLLRVKWVALLGAPLGVLLSIGVGMLAGRLLGWPAAQGIAIGAICSVASTMVLSRFLIDRGELHSQAGRVMIGMVLVEDLAVVVMTVLMPALSNFSQNQLTNVAITLGKALLLLAPLTFVAVKLVPPLLEKVAQTRSQELFILVALGLGFATAALTQALGLSLALGAFLAGMVVSGSEYSHETLAQLLPLRDAFVALFFITIGALINPRALFAHPVLLGVMIGLVVLGKLATRTLVVRCFGYPFWTALLVGIGLTQIGEFSYVLVHVARNSGVVGEDVYNATLAASLFTILLNAALMQFAPRWIGQRILRERSSGIGQAAEGVAGSNGVVLCGFGRVGNAVGTALETFGVHYVVLENDPDIVRALRSRGVPCVFGDAAHRTILEEAGIGGARLAVVTLPEKARAELAVRNARAANPSLPILGRAHRVQDREELLGAGATEVIQPEIEASATLIREALGYLHLPEPSAEAYLESFRQGMASSSHAGGAGSMRLPLVEEVKILSRAGAGLSLEEARVRERFGVTVIAVTRDSGEVLLNPGAQIRMRLGDRLRVFGLPEQIRGFAADYGREEG